MNNKRGRKTVEKAKDFKGTLKKLLNYNRPFINRYII